MSVSTSQFLVSVADCFLRDVANDIIVMRGTAAISTALKQTMASQEQRGGFSNALQFLYQHTKKIDVTIDLANWDESVFALNNGTTIANGLQNYYTEELITLTAGTGTTSNVPVGNKVYVQSVNGGVIQTITSTGTSFTVSGGANNQYRVGYKTSTTVDSIVISADSIPAAYELIMRAKVFTSAGQSAEMEIVIPQFRLMGNFDVTLGAATVSSTKIDGTALADANNNYASVYIKPTSVNTSYIALAAVPESIALSPSQTTSQLNVYGVRGGLYANSNLTAASTGTTYVSSSTSVATVSAGGLITRVGAGSTTIAISNGSITDTVQVTVT